MENVENILPLSPAQRDILLRHLRAPELEEYTEQVCWTVRGAYDAPAFARAWETVIARQPMLRTALFWEGLDRPLQVVHARAALPVERLDWRAVPREEVEGRFLAFLAEDRQRGFRIDSAPLMRLAEIRVADDDFRFVWSHHHLLLDGWSATVCVREVFAAYEAICRGETPHLPPVRPYTRYLAWLAARDGAADERYWRGALAGFDTPVPLGIARAAGHGGAGERYAVHTELLPEALVERLRGAGRRGQLTLNTLLQGAWALLLGHYGGARDVVFGGITSGRPSDLPGAESILGVFVAEVPVRVRIEPDAPLAAWLAGVQAAQAEARAHEHASLAEIQGWSELGAGARLFDTLLVFQNLPDAQLGSASVAGQEVADFRRVPTGGGLGHALLLEVVPRHDGLLLNLTRDLDRVDADAAGRVLEHLARLLEAMADDPSRPVGEVSPLSAAEREGVLAASRPARAYPAEWCIHERFAAVAARTPDAPAVTYGGESLTYAELDRRAERVARALRGRGVGPEARVGVCVERSAELVVALLGVLRAGAAYVPLDPAYPAERLAYVVEDAGIGVVVAQDRVRDRLPAGVATVSMDGAEEEDASPDLPAARVRPDSLAYVIYTSGSTGTPKGVMVEHRQVARLLAATEEWFGFGPQDVWTLFHSYAFDFSVWELWGALLYGGRLVVVPHDTSRSPDLFRELLRAEGVTVLNQTPSAFRPLIQADAAVDGALALRVVVFGGEALDPATLAPWVERHGDERPRLVNMYGITETTVHVTHHPITRADVEEGAASPIGRPIPDLGAYLLDARGEPVAVGVPAELHVGGAGVARGYLGRPELTAERFVPDPFSGAAGARLYRSGDRVRQRADGGLEYLGRIDQQVKIRGHRIELGEVEAALLAHPGVGDGAVVVREDTPGEKRLVAYLAPHAGEDAPGAAELRAWLRERLPEYMVPAAFVEVERLPLTVNGKLDRRALPAPEGAVSERRYVAPRTPAEEVLARIWADVLRVERVGVEDDFFELGGDSIQGIQVASRALREGVRIRPADLFLHPTVAGLAAVATPEGSGAEPADASPENAEEAAYPLAPAQEGILFHSLVAPGNGAYVAQFVFDLLGPLDEAAFERAWRGAVERHPALRSGFVWEGVPRPLQVVRRAVEVPVVREDWRGLSEEEREARLEGWLREDRARPFDLGTPSLMRLALFRTGAEERRAVWTHHHLAMDGWSLALVLRDVAALYEAVVAEAEAHLPPAPDYREYVEWVQRRDPVRSEVFWRAELAGVVPTPLGVDHPAGAPSAGEAGHDRVELRLPEELTAALHAAGRRHGVTVNTLVQGAWALLLARYAGDDEVLFGSVVSGRPAALPGVEEMVGLFINTLPARVRVRPEERLVPWLRALQASQARLREHEATPLAEIQRWSGVPSGEPLFESIVAFENHPTGPESLRAGGVEVVARAVLQQTNYPLTVGVLPGRELVVRLEYAPARFDAAAVERTGEHLRRLLEGMTGADLPLGALDPLSEAERHRLLEIGGGVEGAPADAPPVHELFQAQAARTPDVVAVEHEGERLTYAELNARANQLARHLCALGVGRESRVGICVERGPRMVVAMLGVLKAGGAYVPLDPSYPAERLGFLLADSGVGVLLAEERTAAGLPPHGARTVLLDTGWDAVAAESAADPEPLADARTERLAYVIYTSGSTGTPKGVMVEHGSLASTLLGCIRAAGMREGDVLPSVASFAFDISLFEILSPLLVGGTTLLWSAATALDPRRVVDALGPVTVLHAVPTLMRRVVEAVRAAAPDRRPAGLRVLLVGGDLVPPELVEEMREVFPDAQVLVAYGPTEGTILATLHAVPRTGAFEGHPVGTPLPGTTVRLYDRHRRLVPAGVAGEIHLGGRGVTRGYLGRAELTAERYVEIDGERLYRTGDLGRWRADGTLEFVGRADEQVKVRGYRVEPGEVAAALREHPSVRDAVVVARDDAAGERRLVAYLVPAEGGVEVAEVRARLRERLPEYMVPAAFVTLDALPLNPNGKVDRRALPSPETAARREHAAHLTETERAVAAIWEEVLGVEGVGVNDNFFDLGGHSVLLVRVHARLRERFGDRVALIELFEHRTLGALAAHLDGGRAEEGRKAGLPARRAPRPGTGGGEIAIVAMAGRFPGAPDVEAFWRNLRDGVDSISFFSEEEAASSGVPARLLRDPDYVRAYGVLDDAEAFDAAFFGFSPREATVLNPQHRVFLECAWEVLERAGYSPESLPGRVGVYAAGGQNSYLLNVLSHRELREAVGEFQAFIGNSESIATLTSFKLGLEGPSFNVQSACSSSLIAIHLGMQSLRAGESDMVLAGGVSISLPQKRGYLYQHGGIMSPTGECRAFDADARGTIGGNGVGVVLLRRLEDALEDGDHVLAVIRGSAINNDGSEKVGYTAPRKDGQAAVIAEALAAAGVEPGTVGYVEAHGSGTEVGDPIEVAALASAFGDVERPGSVALGSVKSNVGHLDAAAGVTGVIKTVLALRHEQLPPSLHFERPNPKIDFERSPFFVNTELRPWTRNGAPRRAGISSFGMGGTNAHLVVEEAPAAEPSGPSRPWQLLTLSARTPAALEAATDRLADHLEAHPEQPLADVAHTLHVGRRRFERRRVLVCRDHADAVAALRTRDPRRVFDAAQERNSRPVAFLFPGLGDHYAQMARGLYEAEPAFRREVDRCAEILRPLTGSDVREVLFPGEPAAEQRAEAGAAPAGIDLRRMLGRDGAADPSGDPLGRTELAHPAVFVVEYALTRTWLGWGIRPEVMVGHSLGEYVAATVAGVFELEDALALVAERARLIEALPAGAMLAVPMDPAGVEPLLRDGLALAAVNAPGMCTVSGPVEAVERWEAELTAQGVACRRLNAAHPFHSPGMEPIVDRLTARLAGMRLRAPEVPFVSNVTGRPITAEEATDPAYWARHLCRPVRFAEGMAEVLSDPSRVLLEVGPGRTLGTFALRCGAAEGTVLASLRHAYTRQADQAFLLEMLGRLWMAGARVDWRGFVEGERRRRVLLPTYPFERQRFWVERRKSDRRARDRRRGRRGAPAPRSGGAPGEGWLVVVDGSGAGEALARQLAASGARVATVAEGEDPRAALDALRAEGLARVHVVHPGGTEELAAGGGEDATLHARPELGVRYVAPSGEVEEELAALWGGLLGYVQVGAHDDFFALGGHSLLATQVIYRVRAAFGVDLPLETIFEVPTVAGLAERIEEMRRLDAEQRIPPIVPVPRTEGRPLPLSYAQERLWVLDQVESGSPMYNVPAALELKGEVDVEVARRAMAEIVRRHELLRTIYAVGDDGQPVQVILPHLEVPLPLEDLRHLPEEEWTRAAGERLLAEAQDPIDLSRGPVIRTRLLRFADRRYVLLITIHHIAVDGWSWTLLYREWEALYVAFSRGRPSPLPELAVQYADYAVWQRRILSGALLEESIEFWRESLRGAPTVLELPTDRPHPPVQSYRGGLHGVELPVELIARIRHLCQEAGSTVHLVALAAFQALVMRYTGLEDFLVGSLAMNRLRPETQGLFGFFLNTLPVRARPSGGLRFREHLDHVKDVIVGVYAHSEFPLQMLLETIQPERDPSRNPLIQVLLGFQGFNYPGALPDEPSGLELRDMDEIVRLGDTGMSKFDLSVLVADAGDEKPSSAAVEYNTDLFDRSTIERFMEHYRTLLEAAVAAPDTPLADLPLLAPGEREQLVAGWSTAPAPFPGGTVHERFAAQAARTPDAVAVAFGGESLTYAELEQRAERLAGRLRALGVRPEARVGVCLERSAELVVALLGVLRSGGAFVPLDPGYPAERLAFLVEDAGARVLVTQERVRDRLPEHGAEVVLVDAPGDEARDGAPARAGVLPDNLAYVIYTSGSTGRPKGVRVEHRSLSNLVSAAHRAFGIGQGDVMPSLASYAFDIWLFETLPALLAGGTVRVVPAERVTDVPALARELEDATLLHAVPALMQQVVREVRGSARPLLPSLRAVFVGGDLVPPGLLEEAREVFPAAEVHVLYGPTEGTILASTFPVPATDPVEGHPIGRPLGNVRLYVCDRWGAPLPAGVPGELCIGGAGVARDYLGRPDLTAEKFVPDPFSGEAGARLYRSGDRARWRADGTLEFAGRTDEQVKVRGYRIEPGEIENVLRGHPRVRDAVVAVREDAPGERRLVAYLAAPVGEAPETAEVRAYLRERLPEYMVPTAFVALEELPLTAHGKVDRRALPTPEAQGGAGGGRVAPRTATERTLAGIWAELLRVEEVGAGDSFFELGGDSILSIQMAARARAAGVHLTPRQLFEHPTLAELARVCGEGAAVEAEQGIVTGEVELTPVQRSFLARESPEPHHFNMAALFEVRGPLDARVAERAAARLMEHHDALRMRFRREESGWRQVNAGTVGAVPFERVDLSAVAAEELPAAVEREADRVQRSLELEHGPVVRFAWIALGEGRGARLLVVAHHLVMDGVSWRVLLEDLQTACEQVARGEAVILPPKTTSFQRWAGRLAGFTREGGFDAELAYWTADERRHVVPLPVDLPGEEANTHGSARSVAVSLTEEETRALLQEVPRAYRTRINDVLLTALGRTLAAWTGDARVLVELEGHGREELFADVDVSRTVGWFTSGYPVLLDLRDSASEGEALRGVKEQLRAVPGNGIGYGALRWLGSDEARERLAALPAAQVSFNYLGQFDATLSGDAPFALASEPVGATVSPGARRTHLLGIDGGVLGGRLQLGWSYSEAVHRRETVERLAERFLAELRGLIAHCTTEGAGGWTPSDFPLARLDQRSLDRVLAGGVEVEDLYPLSPMQEGMLFHTLYAPGGAYVGQLAFDLVGGLDACAFERAWQGVVDRYPVLRAGFVWEGVASPVQVVHRSAPLPLHREDWRGIPPEQQAARREAYLAADRARGFDLAAPPLMRLGLFRTGESEHHLVWTQHHLTVDGWSLPLVFRDVAALYTAYASGTEARLPEVRPYRDYVAWLQGRDRAAAAEFWRGMLADVDAATPLGVDVPAAAGAEDAGYAEASLTLPPGVSRELEALTRREGVTANTLVQGAWALLLSRYSGEESVVFGATVSGRSAEVEGVEEMVGLFINTLPLRVRVRPDAPVLPWLREVQAVSVAVREHEYTPLVQVQKWSGVPAGQPLFESILVFENYPVGGALGEGEEALRVLPAGGREQTNYPLTLSAVARGEMTLHADYQRARFEDRAVRRLLAQLGTVLAGFAARPEGRLGEIPLLHGAERRTVLEEWNATAAPSPPATLHGLVSGQAARTPDAVAVVFEGRPLTYGELDRRSDGLARHLRGRGVGPEVRVGVYVERSAEMLVALLGVLKAGGAYVPLDPAYPAERLAFMLEDSGARVLLTEPHLRDRLPAEGGEVVCADASVGWLREEGDEPLEPAAPESAAYVIYTSGSTGRPKGVVVEHRQVVNFLRSMRAEPGMAADDVLLAVTTLSFDIAALELFLPLVAGARVVLAGREAATDPAALAGLLDASGATVMQATPATWRMLLYSGWEGRPGMRILCGGEALPGDLAAALRERCAGLWNVYGPTETTVWSTLHRVEEAGDAVPIGRPIANTRAYVLDAGLQPLPAGVPGELYLGGAGVARGYLGRPELTAGRFVPDPFAADAGARAYRTGDRVRWSADGELEYLGRIDQQVKVRGFRIELGEVEAALRGEEGVVAAAVVARPDAAGGVRLVAYVVPADGSLDVETLRERLRTTLPAHMVPGVFVVLEALPLTPSGKVDRRALPDPEPGAGGEYRAPATEVERVLAEVWAGVLGVERVGAGDSFFQLGGDSILSIQVVARARQAGVRLTPRQLFEHPVLADLARVADAGAGAETEPVPARRWTVPEEVLARALEGAGEAEDAYPLSPMQEGMLFHTLMAPASGAYVGQFAFDLAGELDVDALERAWQGVIDRYPTLRTSFVWEGVESPFQVVHRSVPLPLHREELRALPAAGREERLAAYLREDRESGLDPARAPLTRVALFRTGDDAYRLVWTHHHLTMDGWSMPLVFRDVAALYDAFAVGAEPALPPTRPYREYVDWLGRQDTAAAERFWRGELAGFAAPTPLGVDRPAAPGAAARHEKRTVRLPAAETRELTGVARRYGLTLNTLVQGAWALLLSRYSGEEEVVFGAVLSGRPPELEGVEEMVGLFINTLPVRVPVPGRAGLPEWLGELQRRNLAVREHGFVPLVQVQRWSGVPAGEALFESILVFENYPVPAAMGGSGRRVEVRFREAEEQTSYPLALGVDLGAEMALELEYDADRFAAEAVERMGRHLYTLLAGMAAGPERAVGELPVLDAAERRQVVEAWNDTTRAYPGAELAHEMVSARAAERPDAVAVAFGDRTLTYAELEERANRLARHLRRRGVGPERRVGVCLERGPEMLVAVLGTLRAGGAYVPLDPAYPPERLAEMVEDTRPTLLLTQESLREALPGSGAEAVCLDRDWPEVERESADPVPSVVGPDSLAYVIYTSGSTGRPKGVMVEHGSLRNLLLASGAGMRPDDEVLNLTGFSFDVWILETLLPLAHGAATRLVTREQVLDVDRLADVLPRATVIQAVPVLMGRIAEWARASAGGTLPRLRRAFVGGDRVAPELVDEMRAAFPGAELRVAYGPTEATVDCAWHLLLPGDRGEGYPLGAPLGNMRLYVCDAAGDPVPVGVPGELCVGGAGVARGYLGDPVRTAGKFVPDPFAVEPGARMYRTGDRVRRRHDGVPEFLGRVDRQVKIRGFRVEPGEIEAVLRGHPGVRDVVIAARADAPGEARLVAYLVPAAGAAPDAGELRALLRGRLPEHMVPGAFVTLDALPLTPTGKVDLRALPAPDGARPDREYEAPLTATERAVAEIWSEVLGVERVGINDNFFDLGGHSLLMVRVHSRLRERFGDRVPLIELFEQRTLGALAARLDRREEADAPIQGSQDRAEARRSRTLQQRAARAGRTPGGNPRGRRDD